MFVDLDFLPEVGMDLVRNRTLNCSVCCNITAPLWLKIVPSVLDNEAVCMSSALSLLLMVRQQNYLRSTCSKLLCQSCVSVTVKNIHTKS